MRFQFKNLRPLSSGGYGDLFVGQCSDSGAQIVVKYLREFRTEYCRRAFERAVRLQARGLPGLVPVLGADTAAERPYCVMPYVEGGTLAQHAGRLTPHQLQAVAVELARPLTTLHAANEVHGDLKPDNILVTKDGHLQVADPLGAGSLLTKLFSVNSGGTPGYWAPEVGRGGSISCPGDVYSYCATMHHMVTGQRPKEGRPLELNAAGYRDVPKIREIVAAGCLANPQTRPTMHEVLQMLGGKNWADIQAQRRQREQALAGLCLGVCLMILVLALHGAGRAPERSQYPLPLREGLHQPPMPTSEQRAQVEKIAKLLSESSSGLGDTIAREISDYTVALVSSKDGRLELAGTGTLVSFLESPCILTAAHVWQVKLKTADTVLIPLKENSRQRFSISPNHIVRLGPACSAPWNEWGPDITLLRLPPERVGEIKAFGRSFYNLGIKKERRIDCGVEVRFLMGTPSLRGTFTPTSAFLEVQGMLVLQRGGPFLSIDAPSHVRADFDYIDLEIDTNQPDVPPRFGGVSGGGLWKVFVYPTANGEIESFKVLEGVAFWEEPHSDGLTVRCHGPQSLGTALCHLLL